MCHSKRTIILLLWNALTAAQLLKNISWTCGTQDVNFYKELLTEMGKQKPYDGLLIVQRAPIEDPRIQAIDSLEIPKIIMRNQDEFYYKGKFNNEIIAVLVMELTFHHDLWLLLVNILDNMRQIRILIILVDIANTEELQRNFLSECRRHKITNAVLHFLNSSNSEEMSRECMLLSPYPKYHVQVQTFEALRTYFPPARLNMKGKSIRTLPEQNAPRSIMYRDAKGQLQFSGFAFRIVQLFTEAYNGTLELLYQPQIGKHTHLSVLAKMTKRGQLDMPMSVSPIVNTENLPYHSYPLEFSKWLIMVPCTKRMRVREVYELLLVSEVFFVLMGLAVAFSLIHTLIEKLIYKQTKWPNLLVNVKVLPGLLGQPSILRKSKTLSLCIIYVLIFVTGLFINTTFCAKLQTLITSPPFHGQLRSFGDVKRSGMKILLTTLDRKYLDNYDYASREDVKEVIEYTDNFTKFITYRENFNSSYAYTVTGALWYVFAYVQVFYIQKVFCAYDDFNLRDLMMFGIPLEDNSPYKKPLDHLVLEVHAAGLLHNWQLNAIDVLLKLKKISFRDMSRAKIYDDLTEDDMLLVWRLLVIGLISSFFVFCFEVALHCLMHDKFIIKKF